jgi:3',5'-cyclic AMP phosphodiesterase CpdA
VFVADCGYDQIQKFDADGNFISKLGVKGTGDGEFHDPRGIAVDSSGYVYVADSGNDRIQKFDSNGNFITKWGSCGGGDGEFIYPQGIAVDSSAYVFVTDTWNHRIQKFDADGNFISKWGVEGTGDGEFHYPCGIVVDSSGNVYVADTYNNRIQKFAPGIPAHLPIANAGGPYYGNVNEDIQFYGSGTDPDGDAITAYAWDFNNDAITDSTLQNPTHSWSAAGTYYPALKVQDEMGAWSEWDWCDVNVYEPIPHLGPYPLSSYDKYYVRVFNIDDIGKVYVNGKLITSVNFGQDNLVDITGDLHLGENEINLTVKNLGEGYTWGFEIIHGPTSETIWFSECGEVGVYGCNDNEQTGEKIVYEKKIILELEEREFSAFTFVQLTDVHIGYDAEKELYYILHPFHETEEEREESRKREYEESYERFTAALNSINDLDPKPAFILVTGDHVEWNDPKFFMGFKSAISSFAGHNSIPFYFIPGNHDRRKYNFLLDDNLENYHKSIETPWYEYPEFKEISEDNYLIKPDNFFFEWENYIFIALDSGRDWFDGTLTDLWEMMQKGEAPKGTGLTEEQINKLRSLERAKRKIIFMHHPAINYKVEGCIDNYRDVFIEYCKDPENNVEVVLTGHTHHDGVYNSDWKYRGANWVLWHPPLLYDRPLFVQTRSATKSGLGLYPCFPGYRVIGVGETSTFGISYTTPEFVPVIKAVITGPVNIHAYNSKGEHTGFGSAEVNIPKSFYTGNYNGSAPAMPQMIILYNTSDDYVFKVTSNLESSNLTKQTLNSEENESFNLTVEKQTNNSLTTISYQNISITRNTTANVSFNQTTTNYTMEIDTDGDGEIDEYKAPNSTETNYAPTATIISPENNSIFIHSDEITFDGTGTDLEEGVLTNSSLVWSSDIYGIIGVGNEFDTSNLSAGTHKITLMVNDSAGLSGIDSIEITVNAPDLTLNSSDISFANLNPTEGEIISINVTVHNIGFVNATNVTLHIIDGFPEFQISNLTVKTIPIGENRTVNGS